MTEYSCTTAYWEKVPSTHRPPKSSPPWWNRNVPSGNIPVPAFLPASHRFWRPVAQYRHLPQAGMNEQVTWSPTATRVTAGPTASTMPAPSCPPTTGRRIGASPFWMWSSEWHRPAAKNLILTSLAFGSSSSSSVISHGWPGTRQTAARVVMLMWTPFSGRCGRRATRGLSNDGTSALRGATPRSFTSKPEIWASAGLIQAGEGETRVFREAVVRGDGGQASAGDGTARPGSSSPGSVAM